MQLLDGSIASRSLRRMEADQEQRHRCKIHLLPSEFSGPALPPEMRHPPADTSSACAHALLGRLLLLYIYISRTVRFALQASQQTYLLTCCAVDLSLCACVCCVCCSVRVTAAVGIAWGP